MKLKKNKKKPPSKSFPATPPHPHQGEIIGLISLSFSIILFLSLLSFAYGRETNNWIGLIGHTIGWLFHSGFGITSYLLALYISWVGWKKLIDHPIPHLFFKTLCFAIFLFSAAILVTLLEDQWGAFNDKIERIFYPHIPRWYHPYYLGGFPFHYLYEEIPAINLKTIFNVAGVAIIFSCTLLSSLLFFSGGSLIKIVRTLIDFLKSKETTDAKKEEGFMRHVKLRLPSWETKKKQADTELLSIRPNQELTSRPSLSKKREFEGVETAFKLPSPKLTSPQESNGIPKLSKRDEALRAQRVFNGNFDEYRLPSLELIPLPKKVDSSKLKIELRKQAEVLEETLLSFGIEAKVGQINCGPTINSFEVHPSIGVKVGKIKSLENDIALNMEAKSIRIIAPIPGKAAVGIEVPNPEPQEVNFREMLTAYQQSGQKYKVPILLGKAVNGDYIMNDLTKFPHCIIAGATGSGKSVCINTIIMSIIYNTRPDEVKLLMVDPKKVELTPYTNLPHMIAPVITEPHGAYTALQWLVKEMERRYETLRQVGVRNIQAFNSRTIDKEAEAASGSEIPASMPYIVGIIDELADLMMAANTDIETPIARIAQMARAVGIHLILATQRPSREVITGLIKANFPTRIAFKVASRINSQIILDEVGAEMLLGNGDMLYLPPGSSILQRIQGVFVPDKVIQESIQFVCAQAPVQYLIQSFDSMSGFDIFGDVASSSKGEAEDDLYDQAFEMVTKTGNASTTFLQRKLKIGYARAASLMDILQEHGVVSAQEGSKARRVLIARGSEEEAEELS